MKKVLSALVLISLLAVPAISLAQEPPPEDIPTDVITSGEDLLEIIDNITNWIFVILLAVATLFLIFAGFLFVTAGGNPEQTTKARQMLINALIGVAIALGAKGLVAVVKSLLGA